MSPVAPAAGEHPEPSGSHAPVTAAPVTLQDAGLHELRDSLVAGVRPSREFAETNLEFREAVVAEERAEAFRQCVGHPIQPRNSTAGIRETGPVARYLHPGVGLEGSWDLLARYQPGSEPGGRTKAMRSSEGLVPPVGRTIYGRADKEQPEHGMIVTFDEPCRTITELDVLLIQAPSGEPVRLIPDEQRDSNSVYVFFGLGTHVESLRGRLDRLDDRRWEFSMKPENSETLKAGAA